MLTGVLEVLKGGFKGYLKGVYGGFKGCLRVLKGCLGGVLGVFWGCLGLFSFVWCSGVMGVQCGVPSVGCGV